MEQWILQALLAALVAVVAYLLRQKDEEQAKSIALLFKKHDEDVEKLKVLELKVATDHYIKPELDAKFDKMETTFRLGFESLGSKFDKLTDILVAHVAKEDARDDPHKR